MADSTEHVEKEQLAKEPEEAEKPRQSSDRPRNRVQVSKDSHPLNFYVNLAEKLLHDEEEVELSGLGMGTSPKNKNISSAPWIWGGMHLMSRHPDVRGTG
mmetsp:Transcript_41530/g.163410  ORF Transcript_41530/g.163410 Transcript_41530/m.163410 type:complete len:100 (-) Transcript_41530:484-783(-)